MCSNDIYVKNRKKTTNEWLQLFKDTHGDAFDYSAITHVVNSTSKVEVICKKHGPFRVTPNNHVHHKSGCPKCGNENMRRKNSLSFDEMKEKLSRIRVDEFGIPLYEYFPPYNGQHSKCLAYCKRHQCHFEFDPSPFMTIDSTA